MSKLVLFKNLSNTDVMPAIVIEACEITTALDMLKPLGLTDYSGFCYVNDFDLDKFKFMVLDSTDGSIEGLTEYSKLTLCRDEIDVDMVCLGYEAGSNAVNTLTVVKVILKG